MKNLILIAHFLTIAVFFSMSAQAAPIKFSELQAIFNRAEVKVFPSTYPPDTTVYNIAWIKYDMQSDWTDQVWRVCVELNYVSPDTELDVTDYTLRFFTITQPANAPSWCNEPMLK